MTRGRGWWWLLVGASVLALAQARWPVFVLGWVMPVPFLAVLRHRPGARTRLAFAAVYAAGWAAATLKIVTPPIVPAMAFMFSLPIAFFHLPAFFVWEALVRRRREAMAVAAFAAATAMGEWVQATWTPFVSWGATGYTQLDNLPLLQLASLAGLPGIAFLLSGAAAAVESAMAAADPARRRRVIGVVAAILAAAHVWGTFRLATAIDGPSVRVAAVATDATFHGPPLPDTAALERIEAALGARTERAARAGASLVVWPEAATMARPAEEAAFRARTAELARSLSIELVAGYVVPLSMSPLRYENKFRWFRGDGTEAEVYLKHVPVPGEPAVKGASPLVAHDTALGRLAGAICYDYDVPPIALAHGRLGVDLVALPSSDWRGIDPIHTQMAGVRAIENGFSILRSTRAGLSAGIDARGRLRSWMTALEPGDGVMVVSLPARRVPTLYGRVGDLVVVPLAGILVIALVLLARRRPAAGGETRG